MSTPKARTTKQIADIDDLLAGGDCDAMIVSPNSTAALTPAVEKACARRPAVIVFDRGVTTDCPVTFVHPVAAMALVSRLPNTSLKTFRPVARC